MHQFRSRKWERSLNWIAKLNPTITQMDIYICTQNHNLHLFFPSYRRIQGQSNKNDRIVESVQWLFLKQLGEQTTDTRTYICISPSTHVTLPHFKFQMLKIPCYKLMIPQFDPQVWVRSQQDAKQMKIILNWFWYTMTIVHFTQGQSSGSLNKTYWQE